MNTMPRKSAAIVTTPLANAHAPAAETNGRHAVGAGAELSHAPVFETPREPTKVDARTIPLSRHRAVLCDVLEVCQRIPRFGVDRLVQVGEIAALRKAGRVRIAWSTLFLKAYAIVSTEMPELRRSYVGWPWRRLVESTSTVGVMAINRCQESSGEDVICWGRFYDPQQLSLGELQGALAYYQHEPLELAFKRQMASSRLPRAMRRLLLWCNMNLAPRKRAARLGTFTMSTLAGQGAWNRSHPSLATTSLTYGPVDERGQSLVSLLCDHRAIDGLAAARAIAAIERALQGPIAEELLGLVRRGAAA